MLPHMKTYRFLWAGFLIVTGLLLLTAAAPPRLPEVRAVWVTRFDYRTPADVASIVANCSRAGFTDIFFQVRGNGTVFYPSRIEPWGFEISGTNVSSLGTNPGWDPLQTAVDCAKRQTIRLHAYINVLPGWRGRTEPPRAAGQLWTEHPDWFMVDALGRRMQPVEGWYAFLNPALPEVRQHLARIVSELSRYDLAGLHLDYIRYPYDYKDVARGAWPDASPEELLKHSDFSYDRFSLDAARKQHGQILRRSGWDEFRRSAVSQVVCDLRQVFKSRRGVQSVVSASVLADFDTGTRVAFQDSRRWAKDRMVDWLGPMNYNAALFDERLHTMRKALGRRATAEQMLVGINCAAGEAEIRRQIAAARAAGCRGVALFAYSHLFENHAPTAKASVLLRN